MTLLEFLLAATWAGVIAANVFQGVTYRFLVAVIAMRAMHVAVVVIMAMAMAVIVVVVVVTVWAVDVFVLGHGGYSGM